MINAGLKKGDLVKMANEVEVNEDLNLIYVGPNVTRLGLVQFQGFRGGICGAAKTASEKIPEIAKLVVPAEKLEQARADIARKGSYLNKLYQAVEQAARELR